MDWEGGPKRGAFDETVWACALVLNANRKTEVFGWGSWTVWSKKRGEWGRGCWVLLDGVEQEGGEPGRGAGGGGGGVGWSGRVVKRGGFGG